MVKNKRGQLTIFIIIAVAIVAVVAIFFVLRSQQRIANVPPSIQPVYQTFLSCLQDDAATGISLLESNGGYITLPSLEAGSVYMPFSSQLDFLGNSIPYWYYVSGNNVEKDQVPTLQEMEQQLADYIDGKIRDCVLNDYYQQGFNIDEGIPSSSVSIGANGVSVDLSMNLGITKESDSSFISDHKVLIKSDLAGLYSSAVNVYNYEQKNLFLENYSVDMLRSYAPVDGVDITCSPDIWNADSIFGQLKEGIEANTLAMSTKSANKYFKINLPVSQTVRFLNSQNWPSSFEVNPSQGSSLIANPVGTQAGLGILGFCYVPYHFVYNMKYPVLIQLSSGNEVFQFPMAVIIQGNQPRQAGSGDSEQFGSSQICSNNNIPFEVRTMDNLGNPVASNISYQCASQICNIGQSSSDGVLDANFPQCVNGFISAIANGFKENDFMYSTTQTGSADIILQKEYTRQVDLKVDGAESNKKAIITFSSNDSSTTIVYPDQNSVTLSEDSYTVTVYIYSQSNLNLGQGTYKQCVNGLSGITGLLGIQQKTCVDVNVPSQIITNVLAGGGKTDYYITEDELSRSNTIEIDADSLPTPTDLASLENNYLSFDTKTLGISFI